MSESRFSSPRCPGCGGELQAIALDEVPGAEPRATPISTGERVAPLSVCSTCFGVWFDWWAGETTAISTSLVDLPRGAQASVRGDGCCPRDGLPLESQPYLASGPVVRRCPRCMGLFAAREKIDELAAFAHLLPAHHGTIEDKSVLARLWRLLS